MKAAVMISDGRMKVIVRELRKCGVDVLVGDSENSLKEIEESAGELDFLFLPIRGIDDQGMIHIPFADFNVHKLMRRLNRKAVIFTGLWTNYLKANPENVYNFYDDEKVRYENAGLTAEGALFYYMQKTPKSMYSYTVDLIGYGHVGRRIAALFAKVGIPVRAVDAAAMQDGEIPVISYDEWKSGTPSDVIINTAPATTITEEVALGFGKEVIIIDIASNQVGCEKSVYQMEGITVYAAPGLPGLCAEESAGQILADYVIDHWNLRK